MGSSFAPNLAAPTTEADLANLRFPLMWSPKLDGIRTLIHQDHGPVTRKIKPIPNEALRAFLNSPLLHGMDGETIYGPITDAKVFNTTQSKVMKISGPCPVEADGKFLVFDDFTDVTQPFAVRFTNLEARIKALPAEMHEVVALVPHRIVHNLDDLMNVERICVERGYEGIMGRQLTGLYKFGRSTLKSQDLFKIKRFADFDGKIVGFEEMMHNDNEKVADALGHGKRSSHQENMRPANRLGKLLVTCDEFPGQIIKIGSGYTDALKQEIWDNQAAWMGRTVVGKYQPSGMKDAPRFSVYKGLRSE